MVVEGSRDGHDVMLCNGKFTHCCCMVMEGSRDGHDVMLCNGKLFVGGNVM